MAMEIFNGVVMRTCPGLYSGARIDPLLRNRITCESKIFTRSRRTRVVGEISAFDDKRHMEYYNCCTEERREEKKKMKMKKKKMTTENADWNSVSEKKRAKLVKDLANNLNMLSELGFGIEIDDDKVKTISEAALVLQTHLEHLREEGKKKKVGEMAVMDDSSSSESSDSESDNDEAAAYISMLRNKMAGEQMVVEELKSEGPETEIEQVSSKAVKKVEVCMGGKCKKAGAPVLMEEFEKVLGMGGKVVGCKCMGKCKTAPNVRVFNEEEDDDDDSVRSPRNPLFLGVALDHVPFIVANYLGSS